MINLINLFENLFKLIIVDFYFIFCIFIYFIFSIIFSYNNNKYYLLLLPFSKLIIYWLFLINFIIIYNYIDININLIYYSYNLDSFSLIMKLLILTILILYLIVTFNYLKEESIKSFEYLYLILLSIVGSFLLINSNDFLLLYFAIEIQSFCFYILSAIKYKNNFSTEAALKYFVLGSFSSSILLLGIVVLYSISGIINYCDFYNLLLYYSNTISTYSGFLLGLLFITIGILFKLSVAPFHIWTPDVYEGIPTIIMLFFVVLSKLTYFIVFIKIYLLTFNDFFFEYYFIYYLFIILSLIFGTLGALSQNSIKKILAYSSITHVGFMLTGLMLFLIDGLQSTFYYLMLYIILNFTVFSGLLAIRYMVDNSKLKVIQEFSYIVFINPVLASIFVLNLFSFAGIPPLMGFFAKFYILFSMFKNQMFFLVFIFVLLTVISSIYYINIIRYLYFDSNIEWGFLKFDKISCICLSFFNLLNIFYWLYPVSLLLLSYKISINFFLL
jgi:proton-translocating NADH-quinone oxidoreductase chain N